MRASTSMYVRATAALALTPCLTVTCQHCRGLDPEEPVTSSAYLCSFHDLEITAVFIDDLMQQPDQPDAEFMIVYETRSLRDTRDLLKSTTMDNAYAFADTTSHPRLWRILAEHALEHLDFVMADKAYVRCADYQVGWPEAASAKRWRMKLWECSADDRIRSFLRQCLRGIQQEGL
eukprot:scaffold264658_cov17-Tisochrysis_lutea.AAC.1